MRTIILFALAIGLSTASFAQFEFIEDLTPEGGELEDFGLGATLIGDDLFVAWPHGFGEPAPALQCGEVYHYRKDGDGMFELLSILQAPTCIPGDMFGVSTVALQDDTLVIPALSGLRADGLGNPGDARVWIFERDPDYNVGDVNAGWRPVTHVVGSNVGGNRTMGGLVTLDDDLMLVQSHTMESIFNFRFSVTDGIYVFRRDGDRWSEIEHITGPTAYFGLGYKLTEDQLIVGAPEAQTFGGPGAVYVYDRNGDDFELVQTLTAGPESNFGYFVDVQDDRMAVGAVNLAQPGAVFLFERQSNGLWQEAGKLTPPDRADNDIYGVTGQFADELLIIGAENGLRQADPAAGKVFVYRLEDGEYLLDQELVAPVSSPASDVFGGALISNGSDLIVKAFASVSGGRTALYHFQRETGDGTPEPYELTDGHSGLFYDPARNGEGFMLDMLPDGRGLMFWFTYFDGAPMWLLAIGPVDGNRADMQDVYITEGARFGDDFDLNDVVLTRWGSLVFEFEDCDTGYVSYTSDLGYGSGGFPLQRLANIAGIRCGVTQGTVANGFSGGFYNPARDGEGLQVHIADLDGVRTPVVYWPTYDTEGNQLWLYGRGEIDGDSIVIEDVLQFYGADFGDLFDSADVQSQRWGSLRVDYDGCNDLVLNYASTDPAYGSGTLGMRRLYQLGQTVCLDSPSVQ